MVTTGNNINQNANNSSNNDDKITGKMAKIKIKHRMNASGVNQVGSNGGESVSIAC